MEAQREPAHGIPRVVVEAFRNSEICISKAFSTEQYQALTLLCLTIIPSRLSAMSLSITHGDPIDAVWEPVKEALRTLYLVEDRNLKEVRDEMAITYKFRAT